MNIDSIQNGVVLDHIQAGKSMEIYQYLHLDQLDCSVAIIKNARSNHMERKDIIKIDSPVDLDLDVLGYIDPSITIDIIRDGKTPPRVFHAVGTVEISIPWEDLCLHKINQIKTGIIVVHRKNLTSFLLRII